MDREFGMINMNFKEQNAASSITNTSCHITDTIKNRQPNLTTEQPVPKIGS